MLISVLPTHRRIIFIEGLLWKGPWRPFYPVCSFYRWRNWSPERRSDWGRGKKWHKEVGMGGLEEKSAGNFLVPKEFLTLQRFVLRLECVVPTSDPRGRWPWRDASLSNWERIKEKEPSDLILSFRNYFVLLILRSKCWRNRKITCRKINTVIFLLLQIYTVQGAEKAHGF